MSGLRVAIKCLIAFLAALLFAAPTIRAQDFSNPPGFRLAQTAEDKQVWVNTATGVYHYSGTRWYGNTKQGKLTSEADARIPPIQTSLGRPMKMLLTILLSATTDGQPLSDRVILASLAGIIGLVSGVALAMVKAWLDLRGLRRKEKEERDRERAATRLNYLDPLLVSAKEYAERLGLIQEKVESGGPELTWMVDQFHQVKENPRTDLSSHIMWCNGEGYFAVSTNYLTAAYFFHANKLAREYSRSALSQIEARTLLEQCSRIRRALGGINGIWETLQDSAGDYVRCEDGTLLRYRKFCEQIFRLEERVWILRVLDFYREIDRRTNEEREVMIQSLNGLISSIETMGSSTK